MHFAHGGVVCKSVMMNKEDRHFLGTRTMCCGSRISDLKGSRFKGDKLKQTGMRCVNEDRVGNYSFEITLREGNQQF